jgi:hypothetical protein
VEKEELQRRGGRLLIGHHQIMKATAILTIICAMALSAWADPTDPFEISSPHFSTNTEIVWEAPTNLLPQTFWIYHRLLPRIFSETIISNAIVLGSLQSKGFPKPSTNDFYIWQDEPANWCCAIPDIFSIQPSNASLSYTIPNYPRGSDVKIPDDAAIATRAWKYAPQFGIDPSKLVLKSFFTYYCDTNQNPNEPPNCVYGRGVFLSRKFDDISFFSGDQGDGAEGFSIEFGNYGIVRSFNLCWSDVEYFQSQRTANPKEITQCIRANKVIVLPNPNEEWYFKRIKKLATAKKLVISKITPYYINGTFANVPVNGEPPKYMTPIAVVDGIADFGNSNMIVHLYSPIISSDINRLLGK